jgi:EpsI family protein
MYFIRESAKMTQNTHAFKISSILLIISLVFIFLIARRGEPKVIQMNLGNLPTTIGHYISTDEFMPDSVYKALNADYHIYRHYRASDGTQVDLYIGYYGTAKGGRTGHNPYACLPSSGWAITETGFQNLYANNRTSTVNSIIAVKDDVYDTVLHWYQSDEDKVLDTGIKQNIQRFKSRILHNRNDGAFVRVSMLSDKDGIGRSRMLVKEFAAKVLSLLPHYWPVEN